MHPDMCTYISCIQHLSAFAHLSIVPGDIDTMIRQDWILRRAIRPFCRDLEISRRHLEQLARVCRIIKLMAWAPAVTTGKGVSDDRSRIANSDENTRPTVCTLLRHGRALADFLDCVPNISRPVRPRLRHSRESRFTSGLLAQTSVISLFALCSLVAEIVGRARLHRLSRFVRIAGARFSAVTFTTGRQEPGIGISRRVSVVKNVLTKY